MTIPYGEGEQAEVFKYSLFLVFCNRTVAATIAAITLVVSGSDKQQLNRPRHPHDNTPAGLMFADQGQD